MTDVLGDYPWCSGGDQLALFYAIQREMRPRTTVSIGTADMAETECTREKGLSGRGKLARNEGMPSVFDEDDH